MTTWTASPRATRRTGAPTILLIDDNPGDATLLQAAIAEVSPDCRFFWVESGMAGFEFLLQRGAYATMPRPDLIVVDLKLPIMDGMRFLGLLRANPQLAGQRVLMWTASRPERDRLRAESLGAVACVPKAKTWYEFTVMARGVIEEAERGRVDVARSA